MHKHFLLDSFSILTSAASWLNATLWLCGGAIPMTTCRSRRRKVTVALSGTELGVQVLLLGLCIDM